MRCDCLTSAACSVKAKRKQKRHNGLLKLRHHRIPFQSRLAGMRNHWPAAGRLTHQALRAAPAFQQRDLHTKRLAIVRARIERGVRTWRT